MRDIIYFVRAARRVSIDVRPWLSWIERLATDQKVGGSNPSGRANRKHANLDERLTCFSFTRFLTATAALPPGERIVGFPRRALKRLVPVPCHRRGTLLAARAHAQEQAAMARRLHRPARSQRGVTAAACERPCAGNLRRRAAHAFITNAHCRSPVTGACSARRQTSSAPPCCGSICSGDAPAGCACPSPAVLPCPRRGSACPSRPGRQPARLP